MPKKSLRNSQVIVFSFFSLLTGGIETVCVVAIFSREVGEAKQFPSTELGALIGGLLSPAIDLPSF